MTPIKLKIRPKGNKSYREGNKGDNCHSCFVAKLQIKQLKEKNSDDEPIHFNDKISI